MNEYDAVFALNVGFGSIDQISAPNSPVAVGPFLTPISDVAAICLRCVTILVAVINSVTHAALRSRGHMQGRSRLLGTWRMLTWRREFADTVNGSIRSEPIRSVLSATARTVGYMPLFSKTTGHLPPVFPRLTVRSSNCSTRCSPILELTRCMTITSCTISTPPGIRLGPALIRYASTIPRIDARNLGSACV